MPVSRRRVGRKRNTGRAVWTIEDESALISFLIEHKSEAGDGVDFKQPTWVSAAQELAKRVPHKGAPKTADSCKNKWSKVQISCFLYN